MKIDKQVSQCKQHLNSDYITMAKSLKKETIATTVTASNWHLLTDTVIQFTDTVPIQCIQWYGLCCG